MAQCSSVQWYAVHAVHAKRFVQCGVGEVQCRVCAVLCVCSYMCEQCNGCAVQCRVLECPVLGPGSGCHWLIFFSPQSAPSAPAQALHCTSLQWSLDMEVVCCQKSATIRCSAVWLSAVQWYAVQWYAVQFICIAVHYYSKLDGIAALVANPYQCNSHNTKSLPILQKGRVMKLWSNIFGT